MIQDQVNIDKFLNTFKYSEQQTFGNNSSFNTTEISKDGCRLETHLCDPDLPILGDLELKSKSFLNFKCFFEMQKEIKDYIINNSNADEIEKYKRKGGGSQ